MSAEKRWCEVDDFPKIDVGGKELFLVGCRKCDRSNQKWRVYTDGEVFVCRCVCGHAKDPP